MLLKLLTPIILWAYEKYRYFVGEKDYNIIYRSLEYTIDPDKDYTIQSDFWSREEFYWGSKNINHYVDITREDIQSTPLPENITKCSIHTKYYYNNKVYNYLTSDIEFSWPPRDSTDSLFMPITRAILMNDECKPVRDVTQKIKRYAGPKSNFYGEEVLIRDMFFYDEETMEKEYPYLIITDAMGTSKAFRTQGSLTLVAK